MPEILTEDDVAPGQASRTATLTVRSGDGSETHAVASGARLLQIAVDVDTSLTFVCCRGACGACLVRVRNHPDNLTPRTPAEEKLLRALDAPANTRLACQCSILGDVEIEPVSESELI